MNIKTMFICIGLLFCFSLVKTGFCQSMQNTAVTDDVKTKYENIKQDIINLDNEIRNTEKMIDDNKIELKKAVEIIDTIQTNISSKNMDAKTKNDFKKIIKDVNKIEKSINVKNKNLEKEVEKNKSALKLKIKDKKSMEKSYPSFIQ